MYISNIYEPYYMGIQGLLLTINDLNIMHTCVYFEYIIVLCIIFTKYIVAILQIYPNNLTILHEIITNDINS
jgi:hypothetical protein